MSGRAESAVPIPAKGTCSQEGIEGKETDVREYKSAADFFCVRNMNIGI
jgi:hypothetical protein